MQELSTDDHDRLADALLASLGTDPGTGSAQRIETHISSVILHGDYAYKIKKPVDFGFLDFASLSRRQFYCQEEIRLNGRLAPQIYLDVVPITGSVAAPELGGSGEAIDYAVRMKRFSQDDLMSHLAASGDLTVEAMDAVAGKVAGFHEGVERASPDSDFAAPEAAFRPVEENFEQIRPLLGDAGSVAQLDGLERWSREHYARLREKLADRGRQGWIRECHGDMHLGNMALIDGEVVVFDGIEFNERLRWTDVLGDVGFLAMDLDDRGLHTHANRFLNGYFEHTGDYAALPLLDFYRVYRALVRAKVDALRLGQSLESGDRERIIEDYRSYTQLAERYTTPASPVLLITHGLSGSGKTTVAGEVVDRFGVLRIRSDVERKRLHGLDATARSGAAIDEGIYSADATQATYARLADLAETVLRAGFSVVVDAAFLKGWQRQRFAQLAAGLEIPFAILDIEVPLATLEEWLVRRQARGQDASEAGPEVLERQLASRDPLAGEELEARRVVRGDAPDIERALASVLKHRA